MILSKEENFKTQLNSMYIRKVNKLKIQMNRLL